MLAYAPCSIDIHSTMHYDLSEHLHESDGSIFATKGPYPFWLSPDFTHCYFVFSHSASTWHLSRRYQTLVRNSSVLRTKFLSSKQKIIDVVYEVGENRFLDSVHWTIRKDWHSPSPAASFSWGLTENYVYPSKKCSVRFFGVIPLSLFSLHRHHTFQRHRSAHCWSAAPIHQSQLYTNRFLYVPYFGKFSCL